MSEKRFEFYSDENLVGVLDTVTGKTFNSFEIVDCLNEQQATIEELKAKLKEKEEDERLYANEILELRKTKEEHIKFKSLGGDY